MTNTVDDFLNHKSRRSGGTFLKDWKKDGSIVVWLHTKHVPMAVWSHGLPRVVAREDRNGGAPRKEIWGGSYVCHEKESVLLDQYRRDEDGHRDNPPKRCPLCGMLEWTRTMVETKKLSWTRPMFKFEGTDPTKTQVFLAGGIYGAFGAKNLTPEQRDELAKLGVYQTNAFKQNVMARLGYLLVVVSNADVQAGAQIAQVTGLLGDKVKDCIRKARQPNVLGPERGNPFVNPYAFEWSYSEKALPSNKYDVIRAEGVPLTPLIERAIRGPAVDVTALRTPFDFASMRAILEKHCLLPKGLVPWDRFFAPPAQEDDFGDVGTVPDVGEAPAVETAAAEDDEELFACDECGKPIHANDAVCPHCGCVYDVAPEPEPEPEPEPVKALPKRSAAKPSVAKAQPLPDPDPSNGAGMGEDVYPDF
jgi:hypothetical protein